jgi:outer membrane protein TolC
MYAAMWGLLLPAGLFCGGCVNPGQAGDDLLTRYQQTMLQRSPQSRAADTGPGLVQPREEAAGGALKVEKQDSASYVNLTLEQAVRLALTNSLDIRFVSYDPAISYEQMVQAAAAFDWTVFGSYAHTSTRERSGVSNGVTTTRPVTSVLNKNTTDAFQFGVKNLTPYGGQVQFAWEFSRVKDNSVFDLINPRYTSSQSLQLVQPLLRGYGPDFNLAQLRLARIGYKNTLAQFRQQVETVLAQVQVNYWQLMQVRRIYEIQKDLLIQTEKTRDRVKGRVSLDATQVEVKQTEAAVETRRATLIRAEKNVFDAQDQLARLLADTRLNVLQQYQIVPVSSPVTAPVTLDRSDQLVKALKYNPQMEQARLAIAGADVNVYVAQNGTLPVLNLKASIGPQGLDGRPGEAVGDMYSFGHIDASIGAEFEYPIGNRGPEALLRQRRFERLKSITQLQNLADQLTLALNETIRQVQTSYQEMLAQRAAVDASRLQLQALEDSETIKGNLSPEFLQVKLQAQETLANAQAAEVTAVMSFNNALAQLTQVTGTALQQHNIQLDTQAAIDYRPASSYDKGVPNSRAALAGDLARWIGSPVPGNTFGVSTDPWTGLQGEQPGSEVTVPAEPAGPPVPGAPAPAPATNGAPSSGASGEPAGANGDGD